MKTKILKKAIQYFGTNRQVDKAIEEMAELTKELLKIRHDAEMETILDLKCELADVKIMITQLELIFGNVDKEVEFKMQRLERRMGA